MSDVKKWDDVNGVAVVPEKDESMDPVKLKSHTRTMEDMVEQNDNQLDGIINNLPEETVAEKEAKTSVREQLKGIAPAEIDEARRVRSLCPDRVLC